ncbi:Prophage antirepressor [Virgibacillus subterraneus]|uniref:Prophage antirepressor n=1 Tax=Virgibacillus subterraneus TaxID=621109 RepID=A0A1H8Z074_9BACI|nr:phage antirepressor KilAC domain-containing protein [Virgibacillus subterraneus]SEP57763.1 Prophage antirepressor [Virgibacillus subterraneus]
MNQLTKVFDDQELRIIEQNNEPWFIARDVAAILHFTDAEAMTRYLDDDEKQNLQLVGFKRGAIVINESGLYSVILKSRKEEAKQFKRWITQEVIPSIRKHGAYMTPETVEEALLNPDTIIKLATNLKEEQEKRSQAEYQIKIDKPYTTFGKAVSNSSASINVGAFAKMMYDEHGMKIGRNKMFRWLREKGYLIRTGREKNNPKQQYIEQGLFETTVTVVSRTQGDVESLTTLITGKGQVKLSEKLLNEYEVFV